MDAWFVLKVSSSSIQFAYNLKLIRSIWMAVSFFNDNTSFMNPYQIMEDGDGGREGSWDLGNSGFDKIFEICYASDSFGLAKIHKNIFLLFEAIYLKLAFV